jgi:hypothetical protein
VLWVLGLLSLLLLVKWLLIVVPYEGIAITDERNYFRIAETLSKFRLPNDAHYPPLYPLLLAPGFWFAGGSLKALVALGVIYSSLSVVPTYAFARVLLPRAWAGLATLATCLLPWHYILPRSLWGETVFAGLFIGAGFMAMWAPRRNRWWWDATFGLALGMLYLTRYISLVLLPVLLLVWGLREWGQQAGDDDVRGISRLLRLGMVIAIAAAAYGWWVVGLALKPNLSISDALGFVITGNTDPAQLTLSRLWLYVRWYLAYLVVITIPVLGLLLQSFRQAAEEWASRRHPTLYARAVAFAVASSGALLVASSRHSWRAYYNFPDPERIMGRYLAVMAPVFLVLAFAALWNAPDHPFRSRLSAGVWLLGVPAGLVYVAHRTILGNWLVPFQTAQLSDRGAPEGFVVYLLGGAFWPLAAMPLVTAAVLYIWRSRWAWGPAILLGALAIQLLWPMPAYQAHLHGYEDGAFHGVQIEKALKQAEPDRRRVVLGISEHVVGDSGLKQLFGPEYGTRRFNVTVRINTRIRGLRADTILVPAGTSIDALAKTPEYMLVRASEISTHTAVVATWERHQRGYALIRAE